MTIYGVLAESPSIFPPISLLKCSSFPHPRDYYFWNLCTFPTYTWHVCWNHLVLPCLHGMWFLQFFPVSYPGATWFSKLSPLFWPFIASVLKICLALLTWGVVSETPFFHHICPSMELCSMGGPAHSLSHAFFLHFLGYICYHKLTTSRCQFCWLLLLPASWSMTTHTLL